VRHPVAAPEALERAADYITESLRSLGYGVDEHKFMDNGHPFRKIITTRYGLHSPQERPIVLAHYDTVAGTLGADDNASGVAVLLEIAHVLAAFECKWTVHFVGVSLEENAHDGNACSGTWGSGALPTFIPMRWPEWS